MCGDLENKGIGGGGSGMQSWEGIILCNNIADASN